MTKSQSAWSVVLLCGGLAAAVAISAWAQPPQGSGGPGGKGGPGGGGPPGGRPEPGTVLPPFVRDQLKLTDDQKKKIADLETDVKGKLKKILTDDQMKQFQDLMRRGPQMDGRRGGGPPGEQNQGNKSSLNFDSKILPANEVPNDDQEIAKQFHKNVKVSFTSTHMIVESNGLPDHETGHFPNEHNPNTIRPQSYRFLIPLHPERAESTTATPFGPIGVAINGVPFYNQYNAEGQNAVEGPMAEVFDSCCGHPDQAGRYHYHKYPVCVHNPFKDQEKTGQHSPLIGFAFDGYAIYGPNGERGKPPTDLDECNGHTDAEHGYHYHVTVKYPYILGAYRGEVERANFGMGPPN